MAYVIQSFAKKPTGCWKTMPGKPFENASEAGQAVNKLRAGGRGKSFKVARARSVKE